jgi:hypothetical protein
MVSEGVLGGEILKLFRCAGKVLPNLIGELDDGDDIANSDPKAHLDLSGRVALGLNVTIGKEETL